MLSKHKRKKNPSVITVDIHKSAEKNVLLKGQWKYA